ncbi:hypothetical protein ACFVS7_35935, partial [Streptomyces rubiginosohelvolus]
VSDRLKNEPTGHDAAHVSRVRQLAVRIANQEGGSLFIIEMAAIVHLRASSSGGTTHDPTGRKDDKALRALCNSSGIAL